MIGVNGPTGGGVGDPDVCRELAAYVTAAEAKEVANRLVAGQPASMALAGMPPPRRARMRSLCGRAGLAISGNSPLVAVLRAIEGAHQVQGSVETLWTAPGNLAQHGQLTSSLHVLVDRARESVVCSTFNIQRSSALWVALAAAAKRPDVAVRLYLDTAAADRRPGVGSVGRPKGGPVGGSPTTAEVAAELAGATVLRTRRNGRGGSSTVRNHAKFVSIDHRFLVVTSANMSKSAERLNVELGLVIDDVVVAQGVERQMASFESEIYEVVRRR